MSAECGQCPAGSPASLPSLHNCFSWLAAGAGLQRASWPAPHTSWPRRTQSLTDIVTFKWISANNSVHSNVMAMTVLSARRQVCTLSTALQPQSPSFPSDNLLAVHSAGGVLLGLKCGVRP